MKQESIVPKSDTITLTGKSLENYVSMVLKLLDGARMNKYFPDPEKLKSMFSFYLPKNNYKLYDSLQVNLDTGLPTEKDVTRLAVDWELAPGNLADDTEHELKHRVETNPTEVNVRRYHRFLYSKKLVATPPPPLLKIGLKLRSLDTEKYIAYFNAEVDRFDVSSQKFFKYTLIVGQENVHWTQKQQVHVVGDEIKYTKGFRNLLSKYCVNEAEFAFVLLNDLESVDVEEVLRCQFGPLYFKGSRIPEGMEDIFQKHPDAFILALPSDRASLNINEDKNNDPLAVMYRDVLDPEGKKLRDEKAEAIGYHVYKERKFVCTRRALRDFRKFLRERGARCVVYGV